MDTWLTILMDVAIAGIAVGFIAIVILLKKRQYERTAEICIKGVIRLPSGHDAYYIKECDQDAEWVELGKGTYKLNPHKRRWSRYPPNPFLGLKVLQTQIRTETWDYGNPNPLVAPESDGVLIDHDTHIPLYPVVTSQQIYAYSNNIQATRTIAEEQEYIDMQDQIKKTFGNQPNKWYVYGGIGVVGLLSLISLIIVSQLGGVV